MAKKRMVVRFDLIKEHDGRIYFFLTGGENFEEHYRVVCDVKTGDVLEEQHYKGFNFEERGRGAMIWGPLLARKRVGSTLKYQEALEYAQEMPFVNF